MASVYQQLGAKGIFQKFVTKNACMLLAFFLESFCGVDDFI
jgi:hypothetical protein